MTPRKLTKRVKAAGRVAGKGARVVGKAAGKGVRVVGQTAVKAGAGARRLFRINLANTLTLFNGLSGFLSIIASINERFLTASLLILAGVFFDYFDGKAARFFKEETELGKELDSLSDLVTFGVAPAILVWAIYPSMFSQLSGGLFMLSAAIRLGRFNVQQTKGVFFGVPTTANGYLLPLFVLLGAPEIFFPWYLLVMAFLMNAPIRVKKPL